MPIESIVVVAAVTVAFTMFGLVLAWADRRNPRPPHGAS
jgi:hypothetical protein